jgi:RNA polymerase sigma factor (sigma-70 family)
MDDFEDELVPLQVLSDHQRGVVEEHLDLVEQTLRRHRHLIRRHDGREANELFQEGCLALIDAVRNHDANQHGQFSPYAIARIHFAISRYVHENAAPVRVPFITQRRRRSKGLPACANAQTGLPLRIVQRLGDAAIPPPRRALESENPNPMRLGDLIGERVERAMQQVVDEMKRAPRCAPGTREVIERCAQERWRIPEPEAKTSIRKLAKALDCSIGRITHCEERFRRRMGNALTNDAAYLALRDEARRGERGFDEILTTERLMKLRPDDNLETPRSTIGKRDNSATNRVTRKKTPARRIKDRRHEARKSEQ